MRRIVLATGILIILLGFVSCGTVMLGLSTLAAISGSAKHQLDLQKQSSQGFGLSSAVPAEYQQWVTKAGSLCPSVTPPMIAAQIAAESSWNPTAVSSAGAVGIAQFMPFNWHLIRDENGNGTASPTDPADEIVAQGRLMCSYAAMLSGAYSGEQLQRLTLAAYNIGPYAVLAKGCSKAALPACPATMPSDPSVQAYVSKIMTTMGAYAASPATLAVGGVGGPWQQPVSSWAPSGTFRQSGQHWGMCGWHTGHDYSVPTGTPVRAIHDGTIVHAANGGSPGGTGSAYGLQVIIDHGTIAGKPTRSYYAHLSAFAVRQGQRVTTGTVLGAAGSTGNSTGPHLHLEMTTGPGRPTCETFIDPHAFIVQHANDKPDLATIIKRGTTPAAGQGDQAVAAARSQLGVPYSWGGGGLNGPSSNVDGTVGFDCSSLVRFAWYQATGGQTTIDRTTFQQVQHLTPITRGELQPGDLIFFQTEPGSWSHVGMYVSGTTMVHAPRPGTVIREANFEDTYYSKLPTTYRRVTP